MVTKILVADDEVGIQLLMQQRFQRNILSGEYAFCFATSRQEALGIILNCWIWLSWNQITCP